MSNNIQLHKNDLPDDLKLGNIIAVDGEFMGLNVRRDPLCLIQISTGNSDAHIVRGLLAVVLSAYNNKTPTEILEFDIDAFFTEVDLIKHLSATRGNGLTAMVKKIQNTAAALNA